MLESETALDLAELDDRRMRLAKGMIPPNARTHRVAFADLLRAFAIFAVVADHIANVLPYSRFLGVVSTFGLWGVNCFFVLTGFLLGRPFLEAILDPIAKTLPSTRLFIIRRFWRLFPLYAFAVISTAFASLVHRRNTALLANVAAHLTFLHGFFPAFEGEPFGPLWTMAVDAQFYVVLPTLAFVLYRAARGQSRAARIKIISSALLAAVVIGIAWRDFIVTLQPVVFLDSDRMTVYARNVIGMSPSFAFGAALSLLALLEFRFSRRVCILALATGVGLIVPFCLLGIRNDRATLIYGDLVGGLSAVLLLAGLVEGRFTTLVRIARARRTMEFAALSYAVYLFHKPIIVAAHDFLSAHGHGRSAVDVALFIALIFVLLAAVSVVAHRVVERPFLNLRDASRELPITAGERLPRFDGGLDTGRISSPQQ